MKLPFSKERIPNSIRQMLIQSLRRVYCWVLLPAGLLAFFTLFLVSYYNHSLRQIARASDVTRLVSEDLIQSTWMAVAGRTEYTAAAQQETVTALKSLLQDMYEQASDEEERKFLETALRAANLLFANIDNMNVQLNLCVAVWENEKLMVEIENLSQIICVQMRDFSYMAAIKISHNASHVLRVVLLSVFFIGVMLLLIMRFSSYSIGIVTELIDRPVRNMQNMAQKIADGNLSARVPTPGLCELNRLADSLNMMAEQNAQNIEKQIAAQKEIQKAEMRLLQAQIMPHFLYNTLDTIVWLAEEQRNEQVVDLTMALSNYLRTTLNQGNDFTTLEREILHVQSYLLIQSFRYQNILDYEIQVDPQIQHAVILKLLLQPLVENALYHGLRKCRRRGKITIRAARTQEHTLFFSVSDTGIGIPPEQLTALIRRLCDTNSPPEKGFGLWNIAQRLKLYYGDTRLSFESVPNAGTTVSFQIPFRDSPPPNPPGR